jgi:hypothetical protein
VEGKLAMARRSRRVVAALLVALLGLGAAGLQAPVHADGGAGGGVLTVTSATPTPAL